MKLQTMMIIKAIVCLAFGVPTLVATTVFYSGLGAVLNDAGIFAARQYGASMMGNLMITWFARNSLESDARQAIVLGMCVYDAVGLTVTLIGQFSGVLGPMGWLPVVMYLFFAVGFGYFLLPPRHAVDSPPAVAR